MKHPKLWLKTNYAPFVVYLGSQAILCWTYAEAIDWMSCALRSDRVAVYRRPCRMSKQKLLAARGVVQEVTA